MPGAVIAAVAGSLVSSAVGGALAATAVGSAVIFGTTTVASIGGLVAGGIASAVVGQAFADKPEQPQFSGAPYAAPPLEQQLRDNLLTVRQAITHWQCIYGRARVGGALTYAHETANGDLHLVITLAGHACQEIEEVWFNDEVVPLDSEGYATGTYAGFARVQKSLGGEGDAQPFPTLVNESEGTWTDAHRQAGRCKIYLRLTPNADLFPTGIPNVTCVIKGKKVYDPRSGLTAYSANPSLCIADFLCSEVWMGCTYASEIDETQLIAAANIDDEAVALAAGGTESRYTMNGAFSVNADSRSVLARLLTANAGRVHYLGGVFRILPAAYVSPTITLDEDTLRGVPEVEPRLSSTDLCNAVKGVYVAEDNAWQASDFPPVTNATYLAEDQGERSWRELDLPFTKSAATAQRIAKLELERVRQQISLRWPGKFTCYRLQPGDTVQITFAMLGWSAKVFEVTGSTLVFEEDGAGGVRLGCDLDLRETASSVFTWSAEETAVDAAPDTNLPSPFTVAAPGAPAVAESLYETTGARRVAALVTVSWAGADAYATLYELQYKLTAVSTWSTLPRTSAQLAVILDVAPGTYDFRVKAINALGVSSAWSSTTTRQVQGLAARPAALADVTIQKIGSQALLTFTQSADLDVLRGGRVLVRHSEATSGATWESSFSIGNERGYPGDAAYALVPLKAGTYLLKAEDSSGQQSEDAATVVSDGATALAWSPLDSVTEDATFPGTNDNTIEDGGVLKLVGTGLVDDIADFDAISNLDSFGGIAAAGTYTFSAGIDLGAKTRAQLYSRLVGVVDNLNDLIDEREDNVDDWVDFDGTAGAVADAWVEVRATDGDPAASPEPEWSAWNRLDVSEYHARAFQFRARLITEDPAYNLLVSELRAYAQEVA